MITYKNIPITNVSKTGLNISLAAISSSKLGVSVAPGTLTKDSEDFVLATQADEEVDCLGGLDNEIKVMLVKDLNDGNAVKVAITQRTSFSRGVAVLPALGYEMIELLGFGKVKAGMSDPDSVEFTEFNWV